MNSLTGIRDLDVYLCEYMDDRSICRLIRTCRHYKKLLNTNEIWKNRIMRLLQLNSHGFTMLYSKLPTYNVVQWKMYYACNLYPYLEKLNTITHEQILQLTNGNQIDLIILMNIHNIKQPIIDACKLGGLIYVGCRNGNLFFILWLLANRYTSVNYDEPNELTTETINPQSLWGALKGGQFHVLNYFYTYYKLLPTQIDEFAETEDWYAYAISLSRLDVSEKTVVLDWLMAHQPVTNGFKLLVISLVVSDRLNDEYIRYLLDWLNLKSNLDLNIDERRNLYVFAMIERHTYNSNYPLIRIFDILWSYNIPLTRAIADVLIDYDHLDVNTWLVSKGF